MNCAEQIVVSLNGKWSGTKGMCHCPAHEDDTSSLSVTTGRNGWPIYKCFAGCDQERIKEALQARGLLPTRKPRLPESYVNRPPRPKEEEYERWRLAWAILRAAAKSGKQPDAYLRGRGIRQCPENAMLLTASDSRRLLSDGFPAMVLPIAREGRLVGCHVTTLTKNATRNLERAGAAKKCYGPIKGGYIQLSDEAAWTGGELLVAEGIETALSAMQISNLPGIAAISATNLAALDPPGISDLIVCLDNDDASEDAANKLADRVLNRKVMVTKRLGDSKGYDINDALLAGRLKAVRDAIDNARKVQKSKGHELGLYYLEEFMELEFPKKQYLLDPWLPLPGLVMVHAFSGVSKTWFGMGAAAAIARGEAFMDWPCSKRGRVMYVDGEMPGSDTQNRWRSMGMVPPGSLLVVSGAEFAERGKDLPDLGTEEGRREWDRRIDFFDPDLIIFDNEQALVRSGEYQENLTDSWKPIGQWLMKHRWAGRSIIYVVHDGLQGRSRGNTGRESVMDTIIGLKKPKGAGEWKPGEATKIDLIFDKTRGFFGADAEPRTITYSATEDGIEWEMDSKRNERDEQLIELHEEGLTQQQIAQHMGIDQATVSRIMGRLVREGKLDKRDHRKKAA